MLKEEADGTVRVSLRSLGEVDVRRIAEAHGGGGHRFAAGFSSDDGVDTVVGANRAQASDRASDRPARVPRTASSSSTSPRAGRRTTSSRSSARSTASAGSATRARSIPTRPACCSSASGAPRGCCASSRRPARRTAAPSCSASRRARSTRRARCVDRRPMPIDREQTSRRSCRRFVGDIEQLPPMVSAVKVGGRRLHELARRGEEVERAPRRVHIDRIDVEEFEPGPYPAATVLVECSSGTYIRSLAADLGARARRRRAPRRAAPPARRFVHRSPRPVRSPTSKAIPTRPCCHPAAAMRDLEQVERRRRAGARRRARRHVPCRRVRRRERRARPVRGSRPRRRPARGLRAAAGRGQAGRRRSRRSRRPDPCASSPAATTRPWPRRGRPARSSRSARTTACTSVTRPCCASCASSPTRAASRRRCVTFDRHPAEVVRPGVRAASCSRRSSRSSSSSTRPATSTCAACSLRRGAQQGGRRGLRARGARRRARRPAGGRRRRLPLRAPPGRQRAAARADGRRARVRGARPRPGRRRGRGHRRAVLVDRDPELLAKGDVAEAARARSAGRTRCAGSSSGATGAAREHSASRPPTSPCPHGSASPPTASTRARSSPPTGSSARPRSRSGARPTFYEDGERRCSRRTCSTSTATSTASAVKVRFVERLRGEERFDSVDALVEQMNADVRRRPAAILAGLRHRGTLTLCVSTCWRVPAFSTKTESSLAHARHDRHDRRAPPPRDRHRLAGGAGGAAHRADQPPHGAPEGPQEGPSLAPWAARCSSAAGVGCSTTSDATTSSGTERSSPSSAFAGRTETRGADVRSSFRETTANRSSERDVGCQSPPPGPAAREPSGPLTTGNRRLSPTTSRREVPCLPSADDAIRVSGPINAAGLTMSLETGQLAHLADGAVARPGRRHHAAVHRRHRQAPRGHRLLPADGRRRGAHVRRGQDPRLVLPP